MSEPRFINTSSHPVYVNDPNGHQVIVRPYRELTQFHWRKEEECVMVGAHYANFPGLLEPFPAESVVAAPPAPVVDVPQGVDASAGVGAQASPGRYKATGDVLRPDGSIKKDGEDLADSVAVEGQDDGKQDEPAVDDADGQDDHQDDEPDDDEDRPLEDVPGVTKKLASALRKAGYASALKLAECQTKPRLKKLAAVPGVVDATKLAEAAQDLLGWVEADETE